MKKILKIGVIGLILFLFIGISFFTNSETTKIARQNSPIRIGWQIPWATEGQLVQVLKHTEILQANGFQPEFKGFSFGGPLNEAALADQVDVILTADQPMATLLSKNPNWVIVGRLMYNRVSVYVPPKSSIQTIDDLKEKTIAMPFGAAAQRFALSEEKRAGLTPDKNVHNINLAMEEQAALITDPNSKKWGAIDALAGFDPSPAIFEEKGLIRTLSTGKVVSVIAVSKAYADAHPEIETKLRDAFSKAYAQFKENPTQANAWYREESKLSVSDKALSLAASLEPNLAENTKDIRVTFTEEDLASLQAAADFLKNQGLIKQEVIMKNSIDPSAMTSSTTLEK